MADNEDSEDQTEALTNDTDSVNINEDGSEWVEILGKDVQILTVIPGDGPIAEMGSVVKCSYTCYTMITETYERITSVESIDGILFKIGEGDCVPGLELALRHSRNGCHMRVRCSSKYCYGYIGRPASANGVYGDIAPEVPLEFEIRDVSHVDWSHLEPLNKAIEEIKLRKDCGNRWFSCKDYPRAGRSYSKGIQIAEGSLNALPQESYSSPEANTLQENFLQCMNNLGATYLCTNDFVKAKETCTRVLEMQPDNIKALIRAAKATLGLDEYEECEACLNRLNEIDPGNAEAQKERIKLKKAKKEYYDSSKKMALKMSKKLFETDDRNTVVKTIEENTSDNYTEKSDLLNDGKPVASFDSVKPVETKVSEKPSREEIPPSGSQTIAATNTESVAKITAAVQADESKNTILLLACSFVVILVSVIIGFLVSRQP